MCNRCYQRAWHADRIDGINRYRRAPEEYFFEKVDTRGPCWEWTAGHDRQGYGRFSVGLRSGQSKHQAHRWCYEFLTGETLGELVLDHACRNKACVNPDHLTPMTREAHDAKTLLDTHGMIRVDGITYRVR
jgi:hypothetical protein